ncbi:MAG TPA: dihydrolipoamide acetyltransferase family protein [Patescibacteria group bacterium]|nr:dihydrolipoamide acetyltransferase family protein [Patescibacteria group bacterium]
MPDIGEGLAEAEVARWLVSVGDTVTEDQAVVEMMTDKASVELPSPGAGVIVEQRAAEGDVIKTGSILYVLETEATIGATAPAHEARVEERAPAAPSAGGDAVGVLAPPAVRMLAREKGVDIGRLRGTGPSGRISVEDVKRHAAEPPPATTPASQPAMTGERIKLRGVQRRMAETMALSARSIPHVTGFHELDARAFVDEVGRRRREAEARGSRFRFDTLLVRAAAMALRRHPIFNSSLDEERGEIVIHPDVNVGVATATPDGLIVPVVRRADQLDLSSLAAELDRLTTAAREGRSSVHDLQGGTFTVSNTWAWRGGHGTSLIPPPEVALVAFGRIEEKAVVRGGAVVARPMMPMSVTFDHRVIDGEHGLTFALTLRGLIEDPTQLEPAG